MTHRGKIRKLALLTVALPGAAVALCAALLTTGLLLSVAIVLGVAGMPAQV
ncbi:hypothetical protein OHA21_37245 [Actinoplanes sp. NBC_00393]|uniref:hypothetical protein n=1 Tax=Actinoplanes sp. NBC_00393 TaxID=2975953 RepID=UPI002E21A970